MRAALACVVCTCAGIAGCVALPPTLAPFDKGSDACDCKP